AERAVERERVRGRALVAIGRDGDHAAERGEALAQREQRGRLDAVVLRRQDDRRAPSVSRAARRIAGGGKNPSPVSRSMTPKIRGTSENARIWLFSSPYTVGITPSPSRKPRRAARTTISVSNS